MDVIQIAYTNIQQIPQVLQANRLQIRDLKLLLLHESHVIMVSLWYCTLMILLCNSKMWSNAYFAKTHFTLGEHFSYYLNNSEVGTYLKSSIGTYLDTSRLGEESVWADKVKNLPEYRWTKPLHYIDITVCHKNVTKEVIDEYCQANCVATAILSLVNDLRYNKKYIKDVREYSMLLLHFLQDVNQPMHIFGPLRGGNGVPITVIKRNVSTKTNLHTLWDSILPEYYLNNYNHLVNTSYQPFKMTDMYSYQLYLFQHISDVLQFACERVDINKRVIVFEEYFNPEDFRYLFNHYLEGIVDTFSFITGNTKIEIQEFLKLH